MSDKMRRFLQSQSNMEADRILEEVNRDPSLRDVEAPDSIHDALFAQIDAYEEEKAREILSEEQRELIELGKIFKRRKKMRKYVAAVAAVLCIVGATSITALGGPERLIEKVEWILAGRHQTNVDSDDERIEEMSGVKEAEALAKIEEEFGFAPVRMYYMPGEMKLIACEILRDIQYINLIYQDPKDNILVCVIYPKYRLGSSGDDFEDDLLQEIPSVKEGVPITVKEYWVEETGQNRWEISFKHNSVYYYIKVTNVDYTEVEKIIDGLYFS